MKTSIPETWQHFGWTLSNKRYSLDCTLFGFAPYFLDLHHKAPAWLTCNLGTHYRLNFLKDSYMTDDGLRNHARMVKQNMKSWILPRVMQGGRHSFCKPSWEEMFLCSTLIMVPYSKSWNTGYPSTQPRHVICIDQWPRGGLMINGKYYIQFLSGQKQKFPDLYSMI